MWLLVNLLDFMSNAYLIISFSSIIKGYSVNSLLAIITCRNDFSCSTKYKFYLSYYVYT